MATARGNLQSGAVTFAEVAPSRLDDLSAEHMRLAMMTIDTVTDADDT